MQELNFPSYEFTIEEQEQKKVIFDPVRKKFIPLTPEEWVRQHCIAQLFHQYRWPLGRIAVERAIFPFGLRKRFDIVAFGTDAKPKILIECKAPEQTLTQNVLLQAATYNSKLDSEWMWITNGIQHAWFRRIDGKNRIQSPPIHIE